MRAIHTRHNTEEQQQRFARASMEGESGLQEPQLYFWDGRVGVSLAAWKPYLADYL